MLTQTIDLNDRIAELKHKENDLKDQKDEILGDAKDVKAAIEDAERGSDEHLALQQQYSTIEQEWDAIEGDLVEAEGERKALMRAIEDYGGSEFVIQEFTFDDWNEIQDRIAEASFDFDPQTQNIDGTPKEGAYKSMVVNRAIVQAPPDAPSEAGAMPRQVCNHLYDKINAINTTGETDLGNTSLDEALGDTE